MAWLHLWNSIFFLLTTVVATGGTFSETEKDIMDAIAGNQFIIRTWSLNGSTLFITVKKDNNTILDVSIGVGITKPTTDQNGRIMLKYNQTIQEVCLLFENVSKEDEGLYEMKESFYRTKSISNEIEADAYERKDGTWNLEIYVLGPGEIKQGYVGENISMEFEKSIKQSTLYNYDELSALLAGSSCSVSTDSSLYGRLRCANDDSGKMYKITILNISPREAGLYKLATGRVESARRFLSIKDRPVCAVVGDNMTIGWFYNQQGIKRTLRVIHPNQGVMMLLQQTNHPQIKSNFQHRLLYSGDTSQNFMLLTLLNLRQSDTGLYTTETLHGNTIHGSKEMIVEDIDSTSTTSTIKLNTNYIKTLPSHFASTDIPYGQQNTMNGEDKKTNVQRDAASTIETVSVPIYLVPVIIIAACVGHLVICCLIRIRRKNTNDTKRNRPHALMKNDADLYLTPVGSESSLPIPLTNDGCPDHSNTTQKEQFDTSLGLVHMTHDVCMGGYEIVDIASNDDSRSTLTNEETVYGPPESINTPIQHMSGYITVLGVLETSV